MINDENSGNTGNQYNPYGSTPPNQDEQSPYNEGSVNPAGSNAAGNAPYGQPQYGNPAGSNAAGNAPYGQPQYGNPAGNAPYGQPQYGNLSNAQFDAGQGKKKSKKGLIIGLIAAVVVIAACVCAFLFFESPEKQVILAIDKTYVDSYILDSSPYEKEFGTKEILDNYCENGGETAITATLTDGFETLNGDSLKVETAKDVKNKKISEKASVNVSGQDISVKLLSDGSKTYVTVPDYLNGYFTADNENFGDNFKNSSIFGSSSTDAEGTGSNINLNDYYFPQKYNVSKDIKDESGISKDKFWDNVTVKRDGSKSVIIGKGEKKASEYVITIPEKYAEELVKGYVNDFYDSKYGNSTGNDEVGKLLSDTIYGTDFKDEIDKMKNSAAEAIEDGIQSDVTIDVAIYKSHIAEASFSAKIKDSEDKIQNITLDIKNQGDKNIMSSFSAELKSDKDNTSFLFEYKNDDTSKNEIKTDMNFKMSSSDTENVEMTFTQTYNKDSNEIKGTGEISDDQNSEKYNISYSGKFTQVKKNKALKFELDKISISDGSDSKVLTASFAYSIDTEKTEVESIDSSLPTIDILDSSTTSDDITKFITDNINQDKINEIEQLFGSGMTGSTSGGTLADDDDVSLDDASAGDSTSDSDSDESMDELLSENIDNLYEPEAEKKLSVGDTWTVDGNWEMKVESVEEVPAETADQGTVYRVTYTYKNTGYVDPDGILSGAYLSLDIMRNKAGEIGKNCYLSDNDSYAKEIAVGEELTVKEDISFKTAGPFDAYISAYDKDGNNHIVKWTIQP